MIDIEAEAWKRYPSEQLGTKGMIDSSKRKMFIEGAEWYRQEMLKRQIASNFIKKANEIIDKEVEDYETGN